MGIFDGFKASVDKLKATLAENKNLKDDARDEKKNGSRGTTENPANEPDFDGRLSRKGVPLTKEDVSEALKGLGITSANPTLVEQSQILTLGAPLSEALANKGKAQGSLDQYLADMGVKNLAGLDRVPGLTQSELMRGAKAIVSDREM
jgi:hypothetical protein